MDSAVIEIEQNEFASGAPRADAQQAPPNGPAAVAKPGEFITGAADRKKSSFSHPFRCKTAYIYWGEIRLKLYIKMHAAQREPTAAVSSLDLSQAQYQRLLSCTVRDSRKRKEML